MKKQIPLNVSPSPLPQKPEPRLEQPPQKAAPKAAPYDMAIAFFASIPPREANKWIDKTFSQEQLILAVSQGLSNDPDSLLGQWSQLFLKSFDSFYIKPDIERLVGLGVRPQTIALAMTGIRLSLQLDGMFCQFGDKRTRLRPANALLA